MGTAQNLKMPVNELEKTAEEVNLKYRKAKKALVLKVPVPILVTANGLVAQSSTVDYTGLIKGGQFVAFDAKETQSKTSFPLANIKDHQLTYLQIVEDLGGIAFFLIHFKKIYEDKAFITPISVITDYWEGKMGRKSIPFKAFKKEWLVDLNNYLTKYLDE